MTRDSVARAMAIVICATTSTTRAELSPAAQESPAQERMHVSLLVGMTFPGRMNPHRVSTTHTGVGPVLRLESGLRLASHFEVGAYLSFSHHPITRIDHVDFDVDGRVLLFSVGLAPKVPFSLGDRSVLRIGAILGLNVTSNELALGDRYPGLGFDFGPTVDLRVAVRERLGIVGQLGWVSQIVGHATLPESVSGERGQEYAFPPLVFIVAGIDLVY